MPPMQRDPQSPGSQNAKCALGRRVAEWANGADGWLADGQSEGGMDGWAVLGQR